MIDEIDETLRKLFTEELPIKSKEIEIQFDQPKREWSARLSRPTLNLFLHDIRENVHLRKMQPYWEPVSGDPNTMAEVRKPVRLDLHYLITAWTNEPEDEHRLLGRTLFVLYRYRFIPEKYMSEALKEAQKIPIRIRVAQYDTLEKPSDIWNVVDNQQRAGVNMRLTIAIDPYETILTPIVSTSEIRFGQSKSPREGAFTPGAPHNSSISVRGSIITDQPLESLRMVLVDTNMDVPINEEGKFAIHKIQPGEYTIEVSSVDNGGKSKKHTLTVPSANYDITL